MLARRGDVVPPESRERDAHDVVDSELGCEGLEVRRHLVEDLLGVPDEVELVDHEYQVTYAQERDQEGVPPGLRHDAGPGVHQDECQLGRGGAGDHVARVLLMARCVRHNELATFRREEAVGHIDGDPLLTLRRQTVDQQCEVELAPLGADLLRVRLEGRQVVLEDQLRVVEQPAYERALPVVHTPAGDETEHCLLVVALQVGIDVGDQEVVRRMRHQKYPSAFLSSMEELESPSMTRPTRSELVVSNISWMMPDSVSALLSMAPVSG